MTSVGEIVDVLEEMSGCEIEDQGREVNGPMHFRCDMTTLSSLIEWKPQYTTDAGVRQTYAAMEKWARD